MLPWPARIVLYYYEKLYIFLQGCISIGVRRFYCTFILDVGHVIDIVFLRFLGFLDLTVGPNPVLNESLKISTCEKASSNQR